MNPRIPQTVGIAAHGGKPQSCQYATEVLALLNENKLNVLLEQETAALLQRPSAARTVKEIGETADLVIVLGGDGTILRVARALEGATTPILGVNMGGLGFLTSVRAEELRKTVGQVLRGEYEISERHTLQAILSRGGRQLESHHALNDVVISRGAFSRVVRLQLAIDAEVLTEYVCDGMIFATATGSTAYSLSAGGPILVPTARAFIITPICPHALSNRSVIAGEHSTIRCQVAAAAGELLLTVDGQVQLRMLVGDEVEVRQSARTVQLVTPPGHSYFEVLREKLKWSGANV
jgi:NAD+ kinase